MERERERERWKERKNERKRGTEKEGLREINITVAVEI